MDGDSSCDRCRPHLPPPSLAARSPRWPAAAATSPPKPARPDAGGLADDREPVGVEQPQRGAGDRQGAGDPDVHDPSARGLEGAAGRFQRGALRRCTPPRRTPDGDVTAFLRIADGPAFGDDSLAKLARQRAGSDEYARPPEIQENVELDGVEMYHVAGAVGHGDYAIDIGAIYGENLVEIHIASDAKTPSELQELLDSILASWEWAPRARP